MISQDGGHTLLLNTETDEESLLSNHNFMTQPSDAADDGYHDTPRRNLSNSLDMEILPVNAPPQIPQFEIQPPQQPPQQPQPIQPPLQQQQRAQHTQSRQHQLNPLTPITSIKPRSSAPTSFASICTTVRTNHNSHYSTRSSTRTQWQCATPVISSLIDVDANGPIQFKIINEEVKDKTELRISGLRNLEYHRATLITKNGAMQQLEDHETHRNNMRRMFQRQYDDLYLKFGKVRNMSSSSSSNMTSESLDTSDKSTQDDSEESSSGSAIFSGRRNPNRVKPEDVRLYHRSTDTVEFGEKDKRARELAVVIDKNLCSDADLISTTISKLTRNETIARKSLAKSRILQNIMDQETKVKVQAIRNSKDWQYQRLFNCVVGKISYRANDKSLRRHKLREYVFKRGGMFCVHSANKQQELIYCQQTIMNLFLIHHRYSICIMFISYMI